MHEMMAMKMMEGPDQLSSSSSSHRIPWIEEEEPETRSSIKQSIKL